MTANTFTVIASAFRSNMSTNANLARHEEVYAKLVEMNMCDLKAAIGVYHEEGMPEASREVSLLIENLSWDEVKKVVSLYCNDYEQDCVLVMNQETKACCRNTIGWAEHLGHWSKVTREEALEAGIYTFDTNGQYWLAK